MNNYHKKMNKSATNKQTHEYKCDRILEIISTSNHMTNVKVTKKC